MKNLKINYMNTIQSEINNLSPEKLTTLFHIIFCLNCYSLFFMTEESHMKFIQSYYQFPTIRKPEIFKSFLTQSIKEYVFEFRYPNIIKIIDMINDNYPFAEITKTLVA